MFTDQMRPQTLEEMVGNDVIKAVLGGQLRNGELAHTILLVGGFGTGKTTVARVLANHLNAEVQEINCGAETGIDTIRSIIDSQGLSPLMGDTRLYILDEVHALTKQAQQALLKPAEEPSPTTYFILCTSDPSKLDAALRSRCLELKTQDLSEVDGESLRYSIERLLEKKPDFKFQSKRDLNVVLDAAGTSYRVLYNILEKLYSAATIDKNVRVVTSELVKAVVGTNFEENKLRNENIAKAFINKNLSEALEHIKECEKNNLNAYSTFLGVYRYMKAVYIKRGMDKDVQSLMASMAMHLAQYQLTWLHVESFALSHCRS